MIRCTYSIFTMNDGMIIFSPHPVLLHISSGMLTRITNFKILIRKMRQKWKKFNNRSTPARTMKILFERSLEINMEIIEEKKDDLSLCAWHAHPVFFLLYWGMQLKPKGE